jgi:DNA adenine methylase
MRNNLILFKQQIENIHFSALDFCNFNYDILHAGDFIYADPPYLLTCGSYNDGKRGFRGWTENDDLDLFRILTDLSERGVNFALSNVIEHKGGTNEALVYWALHNGYNIHGINFNYDNCNYQTNNHKNITKEVLITNY